MRRINSDKSDYSVRKILRSICHTVFNQGKISKSIIFASILCSTAVFAQVQTEWVQTYSASGTSCYVDKGEVDKSGNFILGGRTGTTIDILVLKYSPSGNLLWSRIYDRAGSVDWIKDLKLDDSGNVYITAWTNEGTALGGQNWLTLKYSAEGELRWAKSLDWTLHDEDIPFSLTLDNDNNVFVTGYGFAPGGFFNWDFVVAKYDADGILLWTRSYDSGFLQSDWGYSVVTDDSGNAYVSGYAYDRVITTIKYSRNGDSLWTRSFFRNSSEYAIPMYSRIDRQRNIIVNGFYENGLNYCFMTLKYNELGNLLWNNIFDSPIGSHDVANDLYIDDSLNIYIAGRTANFGNDVLIIKYSAKGDTAWIRTYDDSLGGTDEANAITGDQFGNVYVTGRGYNSSTYDDFLTLKYNSNGILEWVKEHTLPTFNVSYVISLDALNNVFISGFNQRTSNQAEILAIKYSQLTNLSTNNNISVADVPSLNCFPNPFNASTKIIYFVPTSGIIRLTIYNIEGQEIGTLIDNFQSMGKHEIVFDGNQLSTGIYFCQLLIEREVCKMFKLLLLK